MRACNACDESITNLSSAPRSRMAADTRGYFVRCTCPTMSTRATLARNATVALVNVTRIWLGRRTVTGNASSISDLSNVSVTLTSTSCWRSISLPGAIASSARKPLTSRRSWSRTTMRSCASGSVRVHAHTARSDMRNARLTIEGSDRVHGTRMTFKTICRITRGQRAGVSPTARAHSYSNITGRVTPSRAAFAANALRSVATSAPNCCFSPSSCVRSMP